MSPNLEDKCTGYFRYPLLRNPTSCILHPCRIALTGVRNPVEQSIRFTTGFLKNRRKVYYFSCNSKTQWRKSVRSNLALNYCNRIWCSRRYALWELPPLLSNIPISSRHKFRGADYTALANVIWLMISSTACRTGKSSY